MSAFQAEYEGSIPLLRSKCGISVNGNLAYLASNQKVGVRIVYTALWEWWN